MPIAFPFFKVLISQNFNGEFFQKFCPKKIHFFTLRKKPPFAQNLFFLFKRKRQKKKQIVEKFIIHGSGLLSRNLDPLPAPPVYTLTLGTPGPVHVTGYDRSR
jgi:hypothetical protein